MKVQIEYLNINSSFLINNKELETETVFTYNPVSRTRKEYILFTLNNKEYVIPQRNTASSYQVGSWTENAKLAKHFNFI